MKTIVHTIRFLILVSLFFVVACSKQYEVNVENQMTPWQQEFVASSMPFSGASLKLEVNGNVDGVARISVFQSSQHRESVKTMLIGPGAFVFSFEESEYWNKYVLIKYDPEAEVVGSFSIKVKFDDN